jgi:hypothetical protein
MGTLVCFRGKLVSSHLFCRVKALTPAGPRLRSSHLGNVSRECRHFLESSTMVDGGQIGVSHWRDSEDESHRRYYRMLVRK